MDWLNRKEIGVDYTNGEDFTPVLDGTFVPFMLKTMRQLAPLYRLLLAAKERADAAGRESAAMRYLALDFETGNTSPLSACALGTAC